MIAVVDRVGKAENQIVGACDKQPYKLLKDKDYKAALTLRSWYGLNELLT